MRPHPVSRAAPVAPPGTARRPFRDNPRLILAGIVVLAVALVALVVVADRSSRLAPDFQTEVVLYALSATNLMMLLALVFVLARNIIKLVVERRRALPFVRFRAKLVAVLLAMTIIPALLVLIVGSRVVLTAVDRWFNAPMDEILVAANQIAGDYYQERQRMVADQAARLARALARVDLAATDVAAVRAAVTPEVNQQRIGMVNVYRVGSEGGPGLTVTPVVAVATASMAQDPPRGATDRLAEQAAGGATEAPWTLEALPGGGELLHAAQPVVDAGGRVRGVVIASDYLSGGLAERSRLMTKAYEDYTQLRVLKQPLAGVYLSFFLMVTLMILVGSTWMGLYLAKRITRPVQMLSVAAREIGAGHLDHRIEHEATDEFGSMIEAFNGMASELASSRRRLERATVTLEQKHQEVEGRRRYIETILERIGTGVISIDAAGRLSTLNSAALTMLSLARDVAGQSAVEVFAREDLRPVAAVLDAAARGREDAVAQELTLVIAGREVTLAAGATRLQGGDGFEGTVLVLDDVTPLIRAQKVAAWREVARRLAHEIKNPLTPIQLSAERMRRKLDETGPAVRDLVDECTKTIIGEVDSLKGLVDEFSQFARMPAPRAVLSDMHALLDDTVALYDGLFADVRFARQYAEGMPSIRLDPEQIRRVIINLVDNAIEAMDRRGTIVLETAHDAAHRVCRIVVADNGPGIPASERDKLFLPYYSTKGRGSGLGLAIVRRIVAEHGGSIEVSDNQPQGTRFTVELPC
ncbi:MAG: ATP-binding protein [Vicinamibacterales bacterium]|nr:ATP-binding protein [Vicinamibacterales bacterium]